MEVKNIDIQFFMHRVLSFVNVLKYSLLLLLCFIAPTLNVKVGIKFDLSLLRVLNTSMS
jgi:hypothetical protein